jgi:2-methylcitrate dehydratase PrpD
MLLDTLGCIISARATEGRADFAWPSPIWSAACGVAGSAYVNGRLADAMDFNDGYGGAHFGGGAVGAALALAREPGITGRDLLTAVAGGYELAGRVQDAIGPYYSTVDGRQAFSPVWGIATPIVYAAAGAASRMLKLDATLTAEAWGLAGSNTPIPVGAKWSSSIDLPNTKYCDAGWCTLAGVMGAMSARLGSTGITTLLDDPGGLLRMVSALHPEHERLFADLGSRWCIRDVVYKALAGVRDVRRRDGQPGGDLREHHPHVDTIERIEIAVGNPLLVPRFVNAQPRTFASLQFNLPHAIAMLLLDVPVGPEWLSLERAADPRVMALRERVRVSEHREPWIAGEERKSNSVRVVTGTGSWFAETSAATPAGNDGQSNRGWNDAQVIAKFNALVQPAEAVRIVDAVMSLDHAESPQTLLDAFARAQPIQ